MSRSKFVENCVPDKKTGETIYIRKCQDTGKHFKYSNSEKNTVVVAELYRSAGKSDNANLSEDGVSVSFELPCNMSFNEAMKNGTLEKLFNQDIASKDNLKINQFNHLGKINSQTGNPEPSSSAVISWVEGELTSKLKEQNKAKLKKSDLELEDASEEDVAKIREEAKKYANKLKQERIDAVKKASKPRFEKVIFSGSYRLNNPDLASILNGEGAFINLQILPNNRRKDNCDVIIHRDNKEEYVYSAYRQYMYSETDAEYLNAMEPNIQFSLPYRIEQIEEWANDKSNPKNSKALSQMMETIVSAKAVYSGMPYVGGVKLNDGKFEWVNKNDVDKTIRLLGLDKEIERNRLSNLKDNISKNNDGAK